MNEISRKFPGERKRGGGMGGRLNKKKDFQLNAIMALPRYMDIDIIEKRFPLGALCANCNFAARKRALDHIYPT